VSRETSTPRRPKGNGTHVVQAVVGSRRARRSLSFYIALLIVLQMVSLFGFIAFVTTSEFRQARTMATERASEDAEKAANLIADAVSAAKSGLVSEAALPGYAAVFDDPNRCTVTSSGAEVFTRGQFHVLRSDGTVACSSTQPAGGIVGSGYAGQSWLPAVATAKEPIATGPVVDPISKRPALIIAAPITEIPGSVVLSLETQSLGKGLDAELGDRDPRSSFVVTTKDRGTEITRSESEEEKRSAIGDTQLAEAMERGTTAVSVDGVERIHAEATVPDLGWTVIAGIGTSQAYADAWGGLRERFLFAGLIFVVVLSIGWLINRRVARPIRALVGAIEEASSGTSTLEVPERGPKEVHWLSRRFNRILRERAEAQVGLVDLFETDKSQSGGHEVDRMKSAFLMAISHELRTPLAAIMGYSDLLQDQMASLSKDEATAIAHDIGLGAERLERLLLDILDLERMSRGVFEARRRATHLRGLVKRALELSDSRGDVKVDVPNGIVADVDPGLVERILDNLIRNATKHTPSGTPIWVKANANRKELELIVEDAGPGIPDELKPEVFEAFTQGKTPTHSPGTGVGLSLVAQFARLHGGQAWVDDRPGGGARFHVTFADAISPAKRGTVTRLSA
jgi:signal transduction histidine kinase